MSKSNNCVVDRRVSKSVTTRVFESSDGG